MVLGSRLCAPSLRLPPLLLGVLLAAKTKGDSIHCIYTDFSQTKDVGRCGTHVRSCKMEQEESRAYEEERRGWRAFLLARLPQGFVSISHCGGAAALIKENCPRNIEEVSNSAVERNRVSPWHHFPCFHSNFFRGPCSFPSPDSLPCSHARLSRSAAQIAPRRRRRGNLSRCLDAPFYCRHSAD